MCQTLGDIIPFDAPTGAAQGANDCLGFIDEKVEFGSVFFS